MRSTSRHLSQSQKRQVTQNTSAQVLQSRQPDALAGCSQLATCRCLRVIVCGFGLSRETRRPAATSLHSVVHSRTWWRPRRVFHVPLCVLSSTPLLGQTLASVRAADCTALQLCRSVVLCHGIGDVGRTLDLLPRQAGRSVPLHQLDLARVPRAILQKVVRGTTP